MKPFFSVLIPTRNRANLLRLALKSVLVQTYSNYEVVISDNNSTDSTFEVVAEMSDERVKYFRTEHDLSLVDNWNNAYIHSDGQYVIMIGDDDYLLPHALETYAQAIQEHPKVRLFFSREAIYSYPDYIDRKYRNVVVHSADTSRELTLCDTQSLLRTIFCFRYPIATQTICYSRDLMEDISWQGYPFHPPFPDHFSAGSALLRIPYAISIGAHLVLIGRNRYGSGYGYIYGQNRAQRWIEEQQSQQDQLESIFIVGNYFPNGYFSSLLLLKDLYPDLTEDYIIDRRGYYDLTWYQIQTAKRFGVPLGETEKETSNVLNQLPIRDRFYVRIRYLARYLRDIAPLYLHNLASLILVGNGSRVVLTKLPSNVTNIDECARHCLVNGIL